MKCLFILFIAIVGLGLSAQHTSIETYDFFGGQDETARNMFVVGDTIYLIGEGDCGEDRCLHFYKMTLDGEVLFTKRYPEIVVPASRAWLREDRIYVTGYETQNDVFSRDGFTAFEFDLDGNRLLSIKITKENLENPPDFNIEEHWPSGIIASEEKVVMYGNVFEDDGGSPLDSGTGPLRRGMLVYLNNDLSFDTLVFIEPIYRNMEMWDADLTADGNFSFLFDYDEWDGSDDFRDRLHYRTFAEYDDSGNLLYRWDPPQIFHSGFLFLSQLILSGGDRIMTLTSTSGGADHDLIRVNQSGEILWRSRQSISGVGVGIADISETQDGNILLAGLTDTRHFDNSAFLRKVDATDGSLIWDRAYTDYSDPVRNRKDAFSTFFKAKEMSDGTILAAGLINNKLYSSDSILVQHDDLQLFRVDNLGCLDAGCGGFEQIVNGTPPFRHLLVEQNHEWQLLDYSSPTGLVKKRYRTFSVESVDLINERKTELHVDVNENIWEVRQDRIFRVDEETKQVFYTEAWETDPDNEVLLYDLNLEVGDLFESEYIDQPLEVIESDTMRLTDRSKARYWVLACTENPEQTITWIDRIGTYHGVVWPPDFCSGDYGPETLTCYYWHDRFTHINPEDEGCLKPSSTDDNDFLTLAAISAHPNPTSDRLTITSPSDLYIERTELMDTKGVTHNRFHNKTTEVYYDLSDYPSGLYLISVYTDKGIVVKKIIVE